MLRKHTQKGYAKVWERKKKAKKLNQNKSVNSAEII